ncbi:MAG: aldose epimerase family protein [Gemmatimonadaceae bacterium]|nr:aldose epimerase family protein [Gemmatimonadaceae bacterium]
MTPTTDEREPEIAPLGVRAGDDELLVATIRAPGGFRMSVLNLGGVVWRLDVPDRYGVSADVVLGYDDPAAYLTDPFCFGGIVGRFANRITKASFPLDGRTVRVTANAGEHHLHGGEQGFHRKCWAMHPFVRPGARGVTLRTTSPHLDEGFPGTLQVEVTYTVTDAHEWIVEYRATTDAPTVVNLTQHSYFNLGRSAHIRDHSLRIDADAYLPVTPEQLPTGERRLVDGTRYDLRSPRSLGAILGAPEHPAEGVDHSFVLRANEAAAVLSAADTGRVLTVRTTMPSVHCYTANYVRDAAGKGGARYAPHCGVCLEAQYFPDSPNQPTFPSTVVRPGTPFAETTTFAFGIAPGTPDDA